MYKIIFLNDNRYPISESEPFDADSRELAESIMYSAPHPMGFAAGLRRLVKL